MGVLALGPTTAVADFVLDLPIRSRVFETLGIDFCCNGRKPLREACRQRGLDTGIVLEALMDTRELPDASEVDWSGDRLADLIDHIEGTHHAVLRAEMPRIRGMLERLSLRHGGQNRDLVRVESIFASFADIMALHVEKEERVVFPLIRAVESSGGRRPRGAPPLSVAIHVIEAEHDEAAASLAELRRLTDGYDPPEESTVLWRTAYAALAELEHDLHAHFHKENNILFPRALGLE
jgi:regulator of cell morphogenesis and NO signaling